MSLYARIAIATCTLGWSMQGVAAHTGTPQEHWVNPGVAVSPPTNLATFTKKSDGAVVGVLERISLAFVDEANPNSLHTVLTIRVNEWLFGEVPHKSERIQVFVHGGTFVETDGKRSPKSAVEHAENLKVGAEYFIPLENGDKFGRERTGRWVASLTVASRLDANGVTPVVPNVRWASDVIAQAKVTAAVPGQSPPNRDVFLTALRTAGREKK